MVNSSALLSITLQPSTWRWFILNWGSSAVQRI